MNVVPFLCPMALNLHQKRPSSVTSGWLFHRATRHEIAAPSFVLMAMVQGNYPRHPPFHRAIRHKIAAPSFVLMGDGARKLPSSSAIPPHNTTRNRSTIIHFDDRWCSKVTPVIRHSTAQYDAKSQCHHSFWCGMVQGNYPRHPPFHHTIRHEIAVPSFVLMGDGAAKLPPSSAIPPHNMTQNCGTIIRFDGRWCKDITPLGVVLF